MWPHKRLRGTCPKCAPAGLQVLDELQSGVVRLAHQLVGCTNWSGVPAGQVWYTGRAARRAAACAAEKPVQMTGSALFELDLGIKLRCAHTRERRQLLSERRAKFRGGHWAVGVGRLLNEQGLFVGAPRPS